MARASFQPTPGKITLRSLLYIDSNLDDKYSRMSCQAATAYSKIELTEHL